MAKLRRFYFHFNKPLSLRLKTVMWSVHWQGACYPVSHIECNVPCQSKTNHRQPYAVMRGFANSVTVENDKAVINGVE